MSAVKSSGAYRDLHDQLRSASALELWLDESREHWLVSFDASDSVHERVILFQVTPVHAPIIIDSVHLISQEGAHWLSEPVRPAGFRAGGGL